MKTEKQNKEMLIPEKVILENKEWEKFAQYCLDRDKGLRKQALGYLNEFLKSTESCEWFHEMAGAARPKFYYICSGSSSSRRRWKPAAS